jgi:predicted anti-sigma-YlaC factor YlaD
MTCEETRKNLPLFLYGELSFDEEELVEGHMDECLACRGALAREKAMFAALDGAEMVPRPELLEESRAELRRRLGQERTGCGKDSRLTSILRRASLKWRERP